MISLRIHQETNHSGKYLVEKITKQNGHTFINHYQLSSEEVSKLISKFDNKNNIEFVKNSGNVNSEKDGPWAQVNQSSSNSGFIFVIIAGKSSSASGFESSSRMMTLIIKFDNEDIVTDFKSRESNF